MLRSSLLLASAVVTALIGCGPPETPRIYGTLTNVRTEGGSPAGITIQDPRTYRTSEFALAFEAGAERPAAQLDQYVAEKIFVLVHYRGTRDKDATAFRVDPSVRGLLIDIKEAGERVELTMKDDAGKQWLLLFEPEPGLDFPVSHLREHMEVKLPLIAFYRERGSELVTYFLADAP